MKRELIESAVGQDVEVEILVYACLYTCCGGGWRTRGGYEQMYVGKVTQAGADYFVVQSAALGKITRVLVEYDHLVEVQVRGRDQS